MNKSINLLVPEKGNDMLRKRLELFRIISVVILLSIVTLSVTLFFLILMSPLPELRQQESAASQKLQQLRSTSGKLFLIRERLGKIDTILKTRSTYDSIITEIQAILPAEAAIDRITVDNDTFSVSVSSSSLQTIQSFIERVTQLKTEKKTFSSLVLSDLIFDSQDPRYVVTVEATL